MPDIQTDDGISLYYEEYGSGEPVLFVHEFGGDYRSWAHQIPVLSRLHRCITFSARGFLPSTVPHDRSSYGQVRATADVLAVIISLGLGSVHLVGTSMGSFTSLDFALNYPDYVRSVTLIGNSSGPRDERERDEYRRNWIEEEIRLRETRDADGAVAVLERDPAYQSFRKNNPAAWATYAENLNGQSVEGAIHILSTLHWNRRSLFDEESRLRALHKSVLLVTGDDDYYLVAETNDFLNRVLPNSTWQNFKDTGHLVNIEKSSEFNALLAKFIESL